MAVEVVALGFICCDCGQRDTLELKPAKNQETLTVALNGHLCFRCRLRAQQVSDRRRSLFLASRQTGR